MTDGPRRSQRAGMVAVCADGAAAAQGPVHRARHADRQPTDAARERGAVVGFHDQMEVVVLHAEVDDAEAAA